MGQRGSGPRPVAVGQPCSWGYHHDTATYRRELKPLLPLGLVVLDRRLDRVLGEQRAVHWDQRSHQQLYDGLTLHGRQAKLLGDLRVLDLPGLLQRHALNSLSHVRARGDGGSTSKRLELDIGDVAALVHSDLQLHHAGVSAVHLSSRRATPTHSPQAGN